MSGYVPGYMYITNMEEWRKVRSGGELYETAINGISVLRPNGIIGQNNQGVPIYTVSGPSGLDAGSWWVPGDVSNINGINYTTGDGNNTYRDQIANAYVRYVNRFAGPAATEYWLDTWLLRGGMNNPAYGGSIDGMLKYELVSSGEQGSVDVTPYAIPYTYYAPEYGCTDSSANNYKAPGPFRQRLFTVTPILSGGSCSYNTAPSTPSTPPPPPPKKPNIKISGVWYKMDKVYIKDAGVWKLCTSAYVKDGGVWKPFLTQ